MKVSFDEKHIKWGFTAFLVILCSIIVFFAIYRMSDVSHIVSKVVSILTPFIYGLIMAYLLCPVYNFTVRNVYALLKRPKREIPKAAAISKAIGTIASLVLLLVIIGGILWMIIPGLVDSVVKIIRLLPSSMDSLKDWLDLRMTRMPGLKDILDGWINNFTDNAIAFVTDRILPEYGAIASSISSGVIGVINVVKNFFIGIIICAYFLNSKETFAAQMKKVMELQIYSLLRKKWADDECRYVFQADPDTKLFLLTSITVGNKALKEVLNSEQPLTTSCSTHSTPPISTTSSTLSTRVIISTPVRAVLCIATYTPLASFDIDLQRPLLL